MHVKAMLDLFDKNLLDMQGSPSYASAIIWTNITKGSSWLNLGSGRYNTDVEARFIACRLPANVIEGAELC
jgi:hypothetical protein